MRRKNAFTLIEVLVAVLLIAILTAAALPNFLEMQTREKVSRAKADMRTIAAAIEAYTVDHQKVMSCRTPKFLCPQCNNTYSGPSVYPQHTGINWVSPRFLWITTPVAYIPSVLQDPFVATGVAKDPGGMISSIYDTYHYWSGMDVCSNTDHRCAGITSGALWILVSIGPDEIMAFGGGAVMQPLSWAQLGVDYDPSNGTISAGAIVRIGGGPGQVYPGYEPQIDRINNKYNVSGI